MAALEICVDTPDGVAVAAAAGVDRIELCSALDLGGLTPGPGLIAAAMAARVPAHGMVRPRTGGFAASEVDLDAMLADIDALKAAGLAGVVIGVARPDGGLDGDALGRLAAAARPMQVTLHRVIDVVPDAGGALETAIALGLDRILTSGSAASAAEGAAAIARLVQRARGRIEIMAGGGVTPDAVRALLATGVDALHASCAVRCDAGAARIGIGPGRRTDPGRIEALQQAMAEAGCVSV